MGQGYGNWQEMAKHPGVSHTEELLLSTEFEGQSDGPGKSWALEEGLPGRSYGLK